MRFRRSGFRVSGFEIRDFLGVSGFRFPVSCFWFRFNSCGFSDWDAECRVLGVGCGGVTRIVA